MIADATPIDALAARAMVAAIRQRAEELGFTLFGVAPAQPSAYGEYLRSWLAEGHAGDMHYLAKRFEERTDPSVYLSGALAVICVAMNYHTAAEPAPAEDGQRLGRIARYALGEDYHEVLKTRLHALADFIRVQSPLAQTRCAVDTAPLMEKELAALAGVGWIGKNTCLINPRAGSFLLLGEIVTTLELPIDAPATDHCGTCTRCLDACPTAAITGPYQLDASRCISYLTIEHRGEIGEPLRSGIGNWLYGCDVCQDVCPHNSRAQPTTEPAFQSRFDGAALDVDAVLLWDESTYRAALRGSAMKRVKLPMLQRNAKIVADNLQSRLG